MSVSRVNRTKIGTKKGLGVCEHRQIYIPRNKTGLTGLQFGTGVNVASGEFRGSSYDTNFLSDKKLWVC